VSADLFGGMTQDRALAAISDDGLYRYSLTRIWDACALAAPATFIMLNPSTADAIVDDPTIRRCVAFAKAWGCGGLHVLNLYALRSTDPRGLWTAPDPVGPDNDAHLTDAACRARHYGSPLVAAWGMNAKPGRTLQVRALPCMSALRCLGVTKSGAPRHPLYLRSDSTLSPWPVIP
jgi:hypothetical protein